MYSSDNETNIIMYDGVIVCIPTLFVTLIIQTMFASIIASTERVRNELIA